LVSEASLPHPAAGFPQDRGEDANFCVRRFPVHERDAGCNGCSTVVHGRGTKGNVKKGSTQVGELQVGIDANPREDGAIIKESEFFFVRNVTTIFWGHEYRGGELLCTLIPLSST